MDNCIFCKIVNHEIPCLKLYEDEKYLAFMDIFPRAKGHALLIPKLHYRWVYDVPAFGEYWEVARKVGMGIQKTLDSSFISFVTMGEEVHHAHIHLLPQTGKADVGVKFTPVLELSKEELADMAASIKNNIVL